jgi:hypothetical protein
MKVELKQGYYFAPPPQKELHLTAARNQKKTESDEEKELTEFRTPCSAIDNIINMMAKYHLLCQCEHSLTLHQVGGYSTMG